MWLGLLFLTPGPNLYARRNPSPSIAHALTPDSPSDPRKLSLRPAVGLGEPVALTHCNDSVAANFA